MGKAPRHAVAEIGLIVVTGLLAGFAGCGGSGRSDDAAPSPTGQKADVSAQAKGRTRPAVSGQRQPGEARHTANGNRQSVPKAFGSNRIDSSNKSHLSHNPARQSASARGHAGPAHPASDPPAKHPLDLVGRVDGRGWYLPWYKRDPKKPDGPPIPVLIAEAETGEITKHAGSPEIVMHQVQARLYQKGVHAANVQAGTVRADQQNEKVFGSGGCRVVSLLNPADTVLTADRITWDAKNTTFLAEGHARVEKRPRDGGVPITQEGGTIVYDMEHNTVTVQ